MAVKAISDESDFAMPSMDRFVGGDGQFRSAGLWSLLRCGPGFGRECFSLAGIAQRHRGRCVLAASWNATISEAKK